MESEVIFEYTKNRRQQSKTFINMGLFCWVYIIGLYGYEFKYGESVSNNFRLIWYLAFSISSIILFLIARWHLKNPATYSVVITKDAFIIDYPESEIWSFNINISDIKRFEYRREISHAGSGILKPGVLLNDKTFHEICLNYGSNLNDMYKAVKSINSDVTFSKKINKKVTGFINED